MQSQYSLRSPAVKRLMREAQELKEPTETYHAHPLEDNLFEWHFTIRGPEDTEFAGGIYHGRIILPPDYPMKPPSIILLTPNGRFETFKKICLSISGHHPESWQPSWSIRTALLAIIGFMPTHGNGAIGSLDYTPEERKVLARRTMEFKCSDCGPINCILKPVTEASKQSNQEAKELAQQINFQGEKEKKPDSDTKSASEPSSSVSSSNPDTTTTAAMSPNGPFPPLPAMGNPFPMMPPFMNPMFNPQTTAAGAPPAIPPQMFMPPFWPPNMPPPQVNQNNPLFWPPGMMPPVPPHTNPSVVSVNATATTETSASITSSSDSSFTAAATTSSPSTNTRSVTSAVSTSTQAKTTMQAGASTSTSQPSVTSTGVPTIPTTSTPSASPTATGLRQRTASQARVQRTAQSADLPTAHPRGRSSGCSLWLMVVIGLALIVLILRRLIMMELLKFDIRF